MPTPRRSKRKSLAERSWCHRGIFPAWAASPSSTTRRALPLRSLLTQKNNRQARVAHKLDGWNGANRPFQFVEAGRNGRVETFCVDRQPFVGIYHQHRGFCDRPISMRASEAEGINERGFVYSAKNKDPRR